MDDVNEATARVDINCMDSTGGSREMKFGNPSKRVNTEY